MKDNFMIMIETWHKPDFGNQENVSGSLSDEVKYTQTRAYNWNNLRIL